MNICPNCKKEFQSYQSFAAHSVTCVHHSQKETCEECGREIFSIYMNIHRDWHSRKDKKCKNCDKTAFGDNVFCSRSCSALYNNFGGVKSKRTSKRHPCKNCGAPTKNQFVFCSMKCRDEFGKDNYIQRWLNGEVSGNTKANRPSTKIRNYLLSVRGEKCEICGWSEINPYTGIIPVNLHHIDGNWRNNKTDNLQILCPNCHSLTKNYGGRNKGNGRNARQEWRKKRRSDPDGTGSALQADNKQGVRLP